MTTFRDAIPNLSIKEIYWAAKPSLFPYQNCKITTVKNKWTHFLTWVLVMSM